MVDKTRIACHIGLWPADKWDQAMTDLFEIGYSGVEDCQPLIYEFRHTVELATQYLQERKLQISGIEWADDFANPDKHPDIRTTILEFAEQASSFQFKNVSVTLTNREVKEDIRSDFQRMASLLNDLGKHCQDHNLQLCIKNQWNERIQSSEEIDRLMNLLDIESVGFAPDTGHLIRAKEDPKQILDTYQEAVRHLYLQDSVVDESHEEGGYFCELEKGELKLGEIVTWYVDTKYTGWVVARLDNHPKNPDEIAAHNFETIGNAKPTKETSWNPFDLFAL